jgi:hypothetical protein
MGSEANAQGLKRYTNFMHVALWVFTAMLDCKTKLSEELGLET